MKLSRCERTGAVRICRDGLAVCQATGEVSFQGIATRLPVYAARVLFRIVCDPGCVSKDQLVEWLVSENPFAEPIYHHTVRKHVSHVRRLLLRSGIKVPIITRQAMGYEFAPGIIHAMRASR